MTNQQHQCEHDCTFRRWVEWIKANQTGWIDFGVVGYDRFSPKSFELVQHFPFLPKTRAFASNIKAYMPQIFKHDL